MPAVVQPATLDRESSAPLAVEEPIFPMRVLVVEDGRNAADILAMFFEMEGHKVSVAYDGIEAVRLCSDFKPQLIFLDIKMPKMDGLEAARRIRSQPGGEKIVIVAVSGFDQDDDKRHCVEAGIDCHLSKPVCPRELRNTIRSFGDRLRPE